MRHPLLPIAALAALVILVCEGFFCIFSRWNDPLRSPSHYAHFVDNNEQWMLLHINDLPEEREKTVRVTAEVVEMADSNGVAVTCHGKMLLYIDKPCTVGVGDELLVLAKPRLPSGADNPHQFDYRRHLYRRGILYTAYIPASDYRIVAHSDKGFKNRVNTMRQKLLNVIHFSSLTPSQQGIAAALLLGWSGDLDSDIQTRFRTAGISHLLCVSGLHVGIIALLAGWCLSFFSNRRPMRFVKGCLQIIAIWAFVIITGMAPSTMRAGLMFSLIAIGKMFFSRPPTLNAIAASALILMVANPLIVFEAGFQFSYAAVIAIVVLVRPLEELIPIPEGKTRVLNLVYALLRKVRTFFCVSLVAQLAVTPLTLYYFHNFPPYFLLANMTVVPFAALLLGSILLMMAFCWWPLAFKATGAMASLLLAATERITSGISRLPNSLIEGIYFDTPMLVLSIGIVFLLGWLILRPRWGVAVATLTAILALVLYSRHIDARCSKQLHCDIYNVGNRTAIEFFVGKESTLLCDSATYANPGKIDYQTSNNLVWRKAKRTLILPLDAVHEDAYLVVNNRFVCFYGHTMRIVDRTNFREHSTSRPHIDYLLLRESPYVTIAELQQQYSFDTIVIASQNSDRRRKAWQTECDTLGVPYK